MSQHSRNVKTEHAVTHLNELHNLVQDMLNQVETQIQADPGRLQVATRKVSATDPLLWLSTQVPPEKVYWKSRTGDLEAAACGVCRAVLKRPDESTRTFIERVREELASVPEYALRMYGGVAFDSGRPVGPSWSQFGNGYFILPLLELRGASGDWTLTLQGDGTCLSDLATLRNRIDGLEEVDAGIPPPVSRHDFPHQEAWIQRVRKALDAFDQGLLDKIVLARKAMYRFDDTLNVFALLRRLQDQTPNCFHFLFQAEGADTFIGASPERLYQRCGMEGRSEAVAGTRPRGSTEKIDRREGEKLLESEKEQREHAYVRDAIMRTLEPLSDSVRLDTRARLLKLSRGQHLYSGFDMQLRPGVRDADVIDQLHPTPAVGGEPRNAALAALRDWEEFNRGWYAAPVGWMETGYSEFAVAIRSGLVHGNCLSLFSGAGIVEGSDPDEEWSEIENKISDFIHILTQR